MHNIPCFLYGFKFVFNNLFYKLIFNQEIFPNHPFDFQLVIYKNFDESLMNELSLFGFILWFYAFNNFHQVFVKEIVQIDPYISFDAL